MPRYEQPRTPADELRLFLAYLRGLSPGEVVLRGAVSDAAADDYAGLVSAAVHRAWQDRGNRPLPPGYVPPHER